MHTMLRADDLEPGHLTIIPALPAGSHLPEGGEGALRRLAGARLLQIGSPAEDGIEGGGLVIDYVAMGCSTPQRIVFGFNDCGMWIEAEAVPVALPIPVDVPV